MLCFLFSSLLLLPLPTLTTAPPIAAMACVLALLHGGALTCFVVVSHREEEREGKCCDEEEMEGTSRWERCRTGVVLRVLCSSIQQHMACQRAARLVMVISLLCPPGCSTWLLCFLPPLLSLSST